MPIIFNINRYKRTCQLAGIDLWSQATVMMDLYYPFTENNKPMIYQIFNLIMNNEKNKNVEEEDKKNWELTSR